MENENNSETPLTLADLRPNMELNGRVAKIELFGAFIDVGADREGLVHISKLQKAKVNRVEDVLAIGDEVTVWVEKVDPNAGRLELTMIRPVTVQWNQIQPNARFTGTVEKIEKFGAFVEIGAERPGLLHVSEMQDEYVADPTDIIKVGDRVEVTVIDVDRKKRQFRLSMKQADYVEEDEEVEAELPTAMEVALRQAMEETPPKKTEATTEDKTSAKRSSQELDDILSRTLSNKVKTGTEGKDKQV